MSNDILGDFKMHGIQAGWVGELKCKVFGQFWADLFNEPT